MDIRLLILSTIVLMPLAIAQMQIYGGNTVNNTINLAPTTGPIFDNTTAFVNMSEYWITENGSLNTVGDLVSSTKGGLDNRFVKKSGDTMVGNLRIDTVGNPLSIYYTGTEVFAIDYTYIGGMIMGLQSKNNYNLCVATEDLTQRFCLYDITDAGNAGKSAYVSSIK